MHPFVFISIYGLLGVSSTKDGFLKHNAQQRFNFGDETFQQAFASVMGCGSDFNARSNLQDVKASLLPMWNVAPKDAEGRLEWRMVRYLAHRYFMQKSSLLIRGFEPGRQVNESHVGTADILSAQVPSLAGVLDSRLSSRGFSLDEVASLVAALEKVISDRESSMLEMAYRQRNVSTKRSLSERELADVVQSYVVQWLFPAAVAGDLLSRPHLLTRSIPEWLEINDFAQGFIKAMKFARARSPVVGQGASIMGQGYSFDDAHEVVSNFVQTFGSFWQSECDGIQTSLEAMDKKGTGRVLLSDFYAAKAAGNWRFGESEQYLRELGALDESLDSKQVIISNYLLGANNCVVANTHYFVCCNNGCEAILNEIEDLVGSPVALPEDILRPLRNMTTDGDAPLKLTATLLAQLDRIAETHGGRVPLHGRLFAQWLHYVFPRECPFPHKSGTVIAMAPDQYGSSYKVEDSVVNTHVSIRNGADASSFVEELDEAQWMTHWSEDEELIADYSHELRAPWDGYRPGSYAAYAAALLALVLLGVGAAPKRDKHDDLASNFAWFGGGPVREAKAHFV